MDEEAEFRKGLENAVKQRDMAIAEKELEIHALRKDGQHEPQLLDEVHKLRRERIEALEEKQQLAYRVIDLEKRLRQTERAAEGQASMLQKEVDLRYQAQSALRERDAQMPSDDYKSRSLRSDFVSGKDMRAALGKEEIRRHTFADTLSSAGDPQFREALSNGPSDSQHVAPYSLNVNPASQVTQSRPADFGQGEYTDYAANSLSMPGHEDSYQREGGNVSLRFTEVQGNNTAAPQLYSTGYGSRQPESNNRFQNSRRGDSDVDVNSAPKSRSPVDIEVRRGRFDDHSMSKDTSQGRASYKEAEDKIYKGPDNEGRVDSYQMMDVQRSISRERVAKDAKSLLGQSCNQMEFVSRFGRGMSQRKYKSPAISPDQRPPDE